MSTILVHICGLENLNKNWKTLHLVVFSLVNRSWVIHVNLELNGVFAVESGSCC